MFKTTFSGTAVLCCLGLALCAKVGSAQTCQGAVNGAYAYSAIGTGFFRVHYSRPSPAPLHDVFQYIYRTTVGRNRQHGILCVVGNAMVRFFRKHRRSARWHQTDGMRTYSLNADCTISATIFDAFGTSKTTTALQGIVLANGSEIDLGVLQNVSNNSVAAPGAFQSSLLIKLVRPLATYCSVNRQSDRFLRADRDGNASCQSSHRHWQYHATGADRSRILSVWARAIRRQRKHFRSGWPYLVVGSALQFVGSYTVNTDCSGILTLGTVSTVAGTAVTPGSTLSVNFVLTQPSAPFTGNRPVIEFSQSSATQTLFGYGEAQ